MCVAGGSTLENPGFQGKRLHSPAVSHCNQNSLHRANEWLQVIRHRLLAGGHALNPSQNPPDVPWNALTFLRTFGLNGKQSDAQSAKTDSFHVEVHLNQFGSSLWWHTLPPDITTTRNSQVAGIFVAKRHYCQCIASWKKNILHFYLEVCVPPGRFAIFPFPGMYCKPPSNKQALCKQRGEGNNPSKKPKPHQ